LYGYGHGLGYGTGSYGYELSSAYGYSGYVPNSTVTCEPTAHR
jgi:hypothetical protein